MRIVFSQAYLYAYEELTKVSGGNWGVGACHEMIKWSSICRRKQTLKNLRESHCKEGQITPEGGPYSDSLQQTAVSQYTLKETATSSSGVKISKILQNIVHVYYAYNQNTCTSGGLVKWELTPKTEVSLFGRTLNCMPNSITHMLHLGHQPLPLTSAPPQGHVPES